MSNENFIAKTKSWSKTFKGGFLERIHLPMCINIRQRKKIEQSCRQRCFLWCENKKKNVFVTAIYNIPLFYFISQQIDAQVHQYVRVNNEQRIYIFTSFFSKSRKVKGPVFWEKEGVCKEKKAMNSSFVVSMFCFYLFICCH